MIPEIQRAMDIIFYHFGPLFALLPLTTWKIKILVKWKKVWIYHHFTQLYEKSWSYAIMLERYDITCEICNFKFLFWVIFCPFTTVAAPKINLKKKKKHLDISSFYMCNKKHDHMMYSSRDMVGNGWNNGWKKWHIWVPQLKKIRHFMK